jgi:SH3 domain protein
MKVSRKNIWFAVCWLILCYSGSAAAETVYVSDQLVITLREGKSTQYKIIKTIKTGTPMELLEENKDDPYMKVRLRSGEEGYVLAQYISRQTPKTVVIDRLQKKVEQLQGEIDQLKTKRAGLEEELKSARNEKASQAQELNSYSAEMERELAKTREELRNLTATYDALRDKSSKVIEISADRDKLQEDLERLSSEAKYLREENSGLMRAGVIKWFLAGGGVFFFGWVIGKISRRKKQGLAL